jgi:hypothetical protein
VVLLILSSAFLAFVGIARIVDPPSSTVVTAPASFALPTPQVVESRADVAWKMMPIASNTWTTIAEYHGGQGVIQRLWLAMFTDPVNVNLRIYFDGASDPQVGPGIPLDLMFTPGFESYVNFQGELFGCNNYAAGSFGGYFSIPMPFNQSFVIQLYNTGPDSEYWVQVFFDSFPNQDAETPLHYYMQLNLGSGTYPNEYPLLSLASPNGVHLKYLKWFFQGYSGYWWEGRFRVYTGGPGMPQSISALHYADVNNSIVTPYAAGAVVKLVSTGTEDKFGSSWNFGGSPYYANTQFGYLYNSAGEYNMVLEGDQFTAYRVFAVPISSAPNEYLVYSWAVGDVKVKPTGSGKWFALVGYYS